MPKYVSAYSDDSSNTVVTVSEGFAKARNLTTLKSDPPTDANGRPRGPREGNRNTKTTATKSAAASTTSTTGGKAASKESSS